MNIDDFILHQREAVVDEYTNSMRTCLIATSRERIDRHANRGYWQVCQLGRRSLASVVVIKKQERPPELWVSWKFKDYRKAFAQYLKEYFGFLGESIPSQYQVDHLQPTFRFKDEYPLYFIRLHLIERSVNASYGAGYERLFNSKEREKEPSGGMHMDWVTFLKAYGVKLPGKASGVVNWANWAWHTAKEFETLEVGDVDSAYHGILAVLNLGYIGTYAPQTLQNNFKS